MNWIANVSSIVIIIYAIWLIIALETDEVKYKTRVDRLNDNYIFLLGFISFVSICLVRIFQEVLA